MDKVFEQAQSDAEAICACVGVLTIYAVHAERLARSGTSLMTAKDVDAVEMGRQMRDGAAAELRTAVAELDKLMQRFGDYFNNGDSCSATMVSLTTPVYAILRKRKEGVSLND